MALYYVTRLTCRRTGRSVLDHRAVRRLRGQSGAVGIDLDSAGLGLHFRGLMNLLSRSQVQYSLEAVRDAIEDSRKANPTST